MKRIVSALAVIIVVILITGCEKIIPKTEYNINEVATIDDIKIELIEAKYMENNVLELVFNIKNGRNNTITLSPDTNFKLYDINKVQLSNKYTTNKNIIKSQETINYTLQYETKKEVYEILFYSGIVENNIKFSFTSLDIE